MQQADCGNTVSANCKLADTGAACARSQAAQMQHCVSYASVIIVAQVIGDHCGVGDHRGTGNHSVAFECIPCILRRAEWSNAMQSVNDQYEARPSQKKIKTIGQPNYQ